MSQIKSYIEENIDEVKIKIENAAKKSGRSSNDILLLAVSKTIDTERIVSKKSLKNMTLWVMV